jgi:HEPN domain-containing protein
MANRAKDWFSQSKRDLEQAKESKEAERHEWACFAAHQAAEKAVKALHLSLGQEIWGHVLSRLLSQLPESVDLPADMIDKGRVLDSYYIPTRYPNGHPEGAPFEHYGELQSEEAIRYASEIIEFAGLKMA